MIVDATPGLTLGTLDLLGEDKTGPYWFETVGEDGALGNPVPVEKAIKSLLMDGSIASIESYDNREIVLQVCVCSEDSYGLAAGEMALMGETRKRNTLIWTPPNALTGSGEPCVFDVVTSWPDWQFNDLSELQTERTYRIVIKALPFARSNTLVTVTSDPPPSGTPTNTLVDNCSSLTGWAATAEASGFGGVSAATVSGVNKASQGFPHGTGTKWVQWTRTGLSEAMSSTPNVRIKYAASLTSGGTPSSLAFEVRLNGVVVAPAARDGDYAWYPFGGTTLTTVSVRASAKFPTVDGTIFLDVDEIYKTDSTTLATSAGQRQTYRSLAVQGSARAQGSLTITDMAVSPAALGSTLVHTTPNALSGFQPNLRRWMEAGPTETTDSSLVAGKYSDLSTQHWFSFEPPPSASYLLMARVKHASSGSYSMTWTGRTRVGSLAVGQDQSGSQSVTLSAGAWKIVAVGQLQLPTAAVGDDPNGTAKCVVGLIGPSGLLLDEAWLFDTDNGRLTWIECGTGTPTAGGDSSILQMLPATLANPVPSLMRGEADSALYGGGTTAEANDSHEFEPPSMNVFLVTTNSVSAKVDLAYYPAFHSHVVPTS